jgi:putative SOS response-associated peptidase YedK
MGHAGAAAVRRGPITNIRNTSSPRWRPWLNVGHRCVVPFNSFCEYADTKPRETPTWFALDDERPLAFLAGIWTTWNGRRGTKANPVEGEHQLFGFLTTDANAEVGAVHPKAMPVILTSTQRAMIPRTGVFSPTSDIRRTRQSPRATVRKKLAARE